MCLNVQRALQRAPEVLEAFETELAPARGADPRLDREIDLVLDRARVADEEASFAASAETSSSPCRGRCSSAMRQVSWSTPSS